MPPTATPDLVELSVAVDGEAAEAVCELFERHGGGAVVEVVQEEGNGPAAARARVLTYIPAGDAEARARLEVGLWHLGQLYPIPDATTRTLAEADWAEAWKAHFTPQRIGPFVVVPSWWAEEVPAALVPIHLDPGMAFGTGLHPTTRLCLLALAERVTPGCEVLDVGTGSGILAIGAARLGAGRVVGLDIDARAVAIAAENAGRNGVALEPFAGTLDSFGAGEFDLVLANLLAGLVTELAPQLWAHTRPGGWLVASGILAEQAQGVRQALSGAGFAPAEVRASGDWVALVAERPAAR